MKIKKLNTEVDTWKARHDLVVQKSTQDLAQYLKILIKYSTAQIFFQFPMNQVHKKINLNWLIN